MKKFVFSMFAATIVAFSFISCGETELTDAELIANIKTNVTYVGTEGTDAATLQISADAYTLSYDELGVFSMGTWTVLDGQMILTGMDGENPSGTGSITKEGKNLDLTFGSLTFNLVVKK